MTLTLVPLSIADANTYVEAHHRHSSRVVGAKFCIGAADAGDLVGVVIAGRPVARHLDDGWTLKVNRLCSTGYRNVGSFLYSAAWRAARAMGYRRIVTYTLASESGSSLRAAGWRVVAELAARPSWDSAARPRPNPYLSSQRVLWEVTA